MEQICIENNDENTHRYAVKGKRLRKRDEKREKETEREIEIEKEAEKETKKERNIKTLK